VYFLKPFFQVVFSLAKMSLEPLATCARKTRREGNQDFSRASGFLLFLGDFYTARKYLLCVWCGVFGLFFDIKKYINVTNYNTNLPKQ
jgi:hypothetical protein